MVDLKPKCNICGKILDLSDMRALADGKGFVCKDCFEQKSPRPRFMQEKEEMPPKEEQNISSEPGLDISTSRPEPTPAIPSGGMFADKEYVCDECNYTFKRSSETVVNTCPYCGKIDCVRVKTARPADDLLDEGFK